MRHRAGSVAWLRELYRDLNKEFYRNKLPKRLPITWFDLPGQIIARVRWAAYIVVDSKDRKKTKYKPRVMHFDRKLKGRHLQRQVGMSMLHEMAHLKLGTEVECREWDGKFDREMLRLAKAGAFNRFW